MGLYKPDNFHFMRIQRDIVDLNELNEKDIEVLLTRAEYSNPCRDGRLAVLSASEDIRKSAGSRYEGDCIILGPDYDQRFKEALKTYPYSLTVLIKDGIPSTKAIVLYASGEDFVYPCVYQILSDGSRKLVIVNSCLIRIAQLIDLPE